jgi:hypothetical protein
MVGTVKSRVSSISLATCAYEVSSGEKYERECRAASAGTSASARMRTVWTLRLCTGRV